MPATARARGKSQVVVALEESDEREKSDAPTSESEMRRSMAGSSRAQVFFVSVSGAEHQ